ncbi:hypothetical protein LSH36_19g08009 [Paralvinella palmiformis]|uniref:Uncharacterized protein n=1 Tax=Paralvinella palmiformis TaxID=53620 RepID=A0AAD9NH97_9ANNE|nr:hypothetical protein LSH36_19g08009 [Paralvinella palmiformis]
MSTNLPQGADYNAVLLFSNSLRTYKANPAVMSAVPEVLPPVSSSSQVTGEALPVPYRKHVIRLRRGRRRPDEVIPDIFADHWLVESPRRIQFEKSTIVSLSDLGVQLDQFYENVVQIPNKYLTSAKSRTRTLTDYVIPRITKFGNQIGMKIRGWKFGGSTVDDTQVILPKEIDILVIVEKFKARSVDLDPGYRMIPLRRFRAKEGERPDEFRFGRSDDGTYLSAMRVARNLYSLIERALKLNPQVELEPFVIDDDRPQIVVTFKNKHRFNFVPAIYVEDEDVHLTTRPYAYDENPGSDMFWRISYSENERHLMAMMDKADRGTRRKAFKLLKALVRVEHTLHGLTSYHVKTVLLHAFDAAVDQTPRWQRQSVETAFSVLLAELQHRLRTKELPHFFIRGYNLFGNVSPRKLASLESRVTYLVNHPSELIRVLKKRAS